MFSGFIGTKLAHLLLDLFWGIWCDLYYTHVYLFLEKFISLFREIYFLERQGTKEGERGRGRERERESKREREVGLTWSRAWAHPKTGLSSLESGLQLTQWRIWTHELWDHDLSQSQMFNWLSQPGAFCKCLFNFISNFFLLAYRNNIILSYSKRSYYLIFGIYLKYLMS